MARDQLRDVLKPNLTQAARALSGDQNRHPLARMIAAGPCGIIAVICRDDQQITRLQPIQNRPYRAIKPPKIAAGAILTSSRRWQEKGVFKTIFLMWSLRFAYWRGADPEKLHKRYYQGG